MSKQQFSLVQEADAMMHRFCARYAAGSPRAISTFLKTAYLVSGLSVEQLAQHRQSLRLIHRFIGRALKVADDHVEQTRQAHRAAAKNPPPLAGENGPQDGGGGAA